MLVKIREENQKIWKRDNDTLKSDMQNIMRAIKLSYEVGFFYTLSVDLKDETICVDSLHYNSIKVEENDENITIAVKNHYTDTLYEFICNYDDVYDINFRTELKHCMGKDEWEFYNK